MSDAAARLDGREHALEGDAGGPPAFDYTESAELFTHAAMIARPPQKSQADAAPARMHRRRGVAYRRFATSAEAIRFAIEELPPAHLLASVLVVDGDRHEGPAIEQLYASPDYPLRRGPARKKRAAPNLASTRTGR